MADHLSIITALDSETKLELILQLLGMGENGMSREVYLDALAELKPLKEEIAKVCGELKLASESLADNPVKFDTHHSSLGNAFNPSYIVKLLEQFRICKNKVDQLWNYIPKNKRDGLESPSYTIKIKQK